MPSIWCVFRLHVRPYPVARREIFPAFTSPAAASKKQPQKNDAGSLAKEEVGALSKADQRKLLKDLMDSPGRDDVKC